MIKQIAIFLENKEGKVSACCKVLKEAGVNLYALSIADTKDFGILRIITDNNEVALTALKNAGFLSSEVELVGLCTDICVVSNALLVKAFFHEKKVSVDSSCCAGVTPKSHGEALNVMRSCQIEVK